jgi:hypothetical protein
MVPGDDQLIPYGQDTTISVMRKKPAALQSDEVVRVAAGTGKTCAVILTHRKCNVTRYAVTNNGSRVVPKFYIDHTASASCGGFHVVTKERAVKVVTGFSRFAFALEPQGELEFDVVEEAEFDETIAGEQSLREFLLGRAKQLAGVLDASTLEKLQEKERRARSRRTLQACATPKSISDAQFQQMTADALLPEDLAEPLKKLLGLRKEHNDVERQISQAQTSEAKVFKNQERLRQNIKSMEKVQSSGSLLSRYLDDLNKDEDDLQATQTQIAALEEQKAVHAASMTQYEITISACAKKLLEEFDAAAKA